MEWVETTGRTIEEALDAALDELGVDENDVEYEVLARPRGGFLGRFGGEARVRARVKPVSREKPDATRRRAGRPRGGERRRNDRSGRGGGERPRRDAAAPGEGRRGHRDSPAEGAANASGRRPRRRGRGRGRGGSNTRTEQEQGVTVDEDTDISVDEQVETAVDFTRGLVDAFGAKATVASRFEDEDTVLVDVTGDDLGLLVGQRGATLAAIEELVRTVVQRQTGGHGVRVHVDVAGYRAKRREALSEFARQLGERVRDEQSDQALEPMAAPDRKVVHDVIAEMDGVTTMSEGEEPRRRVVIRPG